MNSITRKSIEDIKGQIAREIVKLPDSSDPFDEGISIWDMSEGEFNLDIRGIFKGRNDDPFFLTGSRFGKDFTLSEADSVLQTYGLDLEEVRDYLTRVLELVQAEVGSTGPGKDENLPF